MINNVMSEPSVRVNVVLPESLHKRLKKRAATKGCSMRQLILAGIHCVIFEKKGSQSRRVKLPLIASKGPKVNLTNEQIYETTGFP